jgi:hypothetical protein
LNVDRWILVQTGQLFKKKYRKSQGWLFFVAGFLHLVLQCGG